MVEGAPHTAKRLSVVLLGCPLATYIKEGGREERKERGVRGLPWPPLLCSTLGP